MADRDLRVLIQHRLGRSWLNASDEVKARIQREREEAAKRWEAEGARFLCDFHVSGDGVGGYAHSHVFSVPSHEMGYKISADIWNSEAAKVFERINIVFGWGWSEIPK